MIVVPAVRTPLSAERARDALLAALPGLDRETAALLLALVWVETGRGGLMNNNAGNISAGPSSAGTVWRPPWFEVTPQMAAKPDLMLLHARMLKGEAPSAFRAYSSPAEGFADFARLLRGTFSSVLAAAGTGDPASMVRALHDSGYSKDYGPRHIGTFAELRSLFLPLVAQLPAGASSAAGAGVGLAIAAGLGLYALNRKRRKRR
jgi:hypothetical protein